MKRLILKHVLLSLLLFVFSQNTRAQLIINEIMQGNVDCVIDDLNDLPESWVEIYNPGSLICSLKDYRISKENNFENAYILPDKKVQQWAKVLIYCDKLGQDMHADFKLESGKGCSVYLFKPDGTLADSITNLKKQPAPNISYGRATDGSKEFGYMLTPTPAGDNKGGVVERSAILPEPIFSQTGKVYENSGSRMSVTISVPEDAPAGTIIRYTTDGSEPTASSPSGETKRTLSFTDTKIIRAKLFCEGYLSPRSTTHSFIFHKRAVTIPVISIATDKKYFYDNKIGIYVKGTYSSDKENFRYNWKRPINIEYFPGSGEEATINQICETRIQGAYTRNSQVKSLAVYADKRLGNSRIKYEFFPTMKPGVNEFKSVALRNSGNDFNDLYFRDAAIQYNLGKNQDVEWQAWQPAAIYLNGTYLGMLNVRERSNDDNILANYGLEDIDVIENGDITSKEEALKCGTYDEYEKFKAFYDASANAENTNMDNYAQYLDIDNYLNVMATQIFVSNKDFPGNNYEIWRERTPEGRWRFIMKDTDFGLGLYGNSYEHKYLDWLNNPEDNAANQYQHTRLYRRLTQDQRFKDLLVDRLIIGMGSYLNGDSFKEVIDSMYNVIKTEYPNHRALINAWWPNHQTVVNDAKTWAVNRTTFMWKYVKDYFQLPGTKKTLQVNTSVSDEQLSGINITINSTKIKSGKYNGGFFSQRDIILEAKQKEENGAVVSGWNVEYTTTAGAKKTKSFTGNNMTFTYPSDANTVSITAIFDTTGIYAADVDTDNATDNADGIFTIDGKRVASPSTPGIYIIRKGGVSRKIVHN